MNIYELIQKVINEIENKIEDKIDIDMLASNIGMSQSNVYRFFLSLVGYNIKEYIRLRRISEAAAKLKENYKATELAFLYAYDSLDSFSRAFKKVTGILPSKYKKYHTIFQFKKIDIIERNFMNLEEKALEIKILKDVDDMEVVSFNYFGSNPEDGAFELFKKWIKDNNVDIVKEGLRVFGYNNPNPTDNSGVYGYEVCVTLNERIKERINKNEISKIDGGMYALVTVKKETNKHIGESIAETWQRFGKWLETSKFRLDSRQWLEEHHGFDSDLNHIGNVDLYMSINYKDTKLVNDEIRHMHQREVNYYKFLGKNAIEEGRLYITKWFKDNNIDLKKEQAPIYIFGNYDISKKNTNDLEFRLCFITENISYKEKVEKILVLGGTYVRRFIDYGNIDKSWKELFDKYGSNQEYEVNSSIVYEQYLMDTYTFNNQTLVLQLLDVKKK